MFWNVTFIYNAFIRTRDHCKLQTVFVSLFYIFINMRALSRRGSGVIENAASAAFSDVNGEQYEVWGKGSRGNRGREGRGWEGRKRGKGQKNRDVLRLPVEY